MSDVPHRILVYGVTGSGKTVLAQRLSQATGIAWHSVDDLTWEPGWVEVPTDEQRRRIAAICQLPEWILDTAYGKWLEVPLARVELIVALDYTRWLSLQRLVRRTVMRLVDRRTVCNGNRESLRGLLSKDAIVVWHFRSFKRKRERIRRWSRDSGWPSTSIERTLSPSKSRLKRDKFWVARAEIVVTPPSWSEAGS